MRGLGSRVRLIALVSSGIVVIGGGAGAYLAFADGSQSGAGASSGRSAKAKASCPNRARDARHLPPGGVATASRTALDTVDSIYGGPHGINTKGAFVSLAGHAPAVGVRGKAAKEMCGRRTYLRTVVVFLKFPKMKPSASLSQGVVYVSRFDSGFRVWQVEH